MKDKQDHFNVLRKLNNKPKSTQRELAQELGFSLGKLNYCLKALKTKGLIKVKNFEKNPNKLNYIYVLTPRGIAEKTKRFAVKVLKKAQENEVSAGKDPMGLAAAALYLSCVRNGEDKTQRDIAEAANVTEVTIRNRYKGLKETLDL